MRIFAFVLLSACQFELKRLPEEAPAFLGDFSGLYSNGVKNSGANNINVIVVAGKLIVAPPSSQGSQEHASFTIIGDIVTGDGLPTADTVAAIPIDGTNNATVKAHVSLGFDAASITFSTLDGMPGALPCPGSNDSSKAPSASSCDFKISKVCDFDSRLAGVFATDVALEEQSGSCDDVPSFEGSRQWSLTAVNSTSESAVVSLKDGAPEMAVLLSFDHATETFAIDRALPVKDAPDWQAGSAFSASISTDSDVVLLLAHWTRVVGSCKQTYSAQGTRKNGTKQGIPCPASTTDAVSGCTTKLNACPLLPDEISSVQVLSVRSNDGCPEQTCTSRVQVSALCEDGMSARIAKVGCPPDQRLALDSLQQPNNNGGKCLALSCVAGVCDQQQQGGDRHVGAADVCLAGEYVELVDHNDGCIGVECVQPNPACQSSPPPCGRAVGLSSAWTQLRVEEGQCPQLICPIDSSNVTTFLEHDAVNVASLLPLLAQGYRIARFEPPLGSDHGQGMPVVSHPIIEPAASGSEGSCPPLDLSLLTMACPPANFGALRCAYSDTPGATTVKNALVLQQAQGTTCLGIYNLANGVGISGTNAFNQCQNGFASCCKTAEPLQMQCSAARDAQHLVLGGYVSNLPSGHMLQLDDGFGHFENLHAGNYALSDLRNQGESYNYTFAPASSAHCAFVNAPSGVMGPSDNFTLDLSCGYAAVGSYVALSGSVDLQLSLPGGASESINLPATPSSTPFSFATVLADKTVFTVAASGPNPCSVNGNSGGSSFGQVLGDDMFFSVSCN